MTLLKSTLFTAASEAVKLGFIGVAIIEGGFDKVKEEVISGMGFTSKLIHFCSGQN